MKFRKQKMTRVELVGLFLMTASILLILIAPVQAQDIVYCQKMGDLSGQVYTFEGYCPIGYIRVQ